jgi:chemotaxis protein MotB
MDMENSAPTGAWAVRAAPRLDDYSLGILTEIAQIINEVPNKISISGHTDATPYAGTPDYTNWELSADRADAARRALVLGGLLEEKVARVVGLSSAVPFFKQDQLASSNRRISIIVMKRDMEASLGELPDATPESAPAAPADEFTR